MGLTSLTIGSSLPVGRLVRIGGFCGHSRTCQGILSLRRAPRFLISSRAGWGRSCRLSKRFTARSLRPLEESDRDLPDVGVSGKEPDCEETPGVPRACPPAKNGARSITCSKSSPHSQKMASIGSPGIDREILGVRWGICWASSRRRCMALMNANHSSARAKFNP